MTVARTAIVVANALSTLDLDAYFDTLRAFVEWAEKNPDATDADAVAMAKGLSVPDPEAYRAAMDTIGAELGGLARSWMAEQLGDGGQLGTGTDDLDTLLDNGVFDLLGVESGQVPHGLDGMAIAAAALTEADDVDTARLLAQTLVFMAGHAVDDVFPDADLDAVANLAAQLDDVETVEDAVREARRWSA